MALSKLCSSIRALSTPTMCQGGDWKFVMISRTGSSPVVDTICQEVTCSAIRVKRYPLTTRVRSILLTASSVEEEFTSHTHTPTFECQNRYCSTECALLSSFALLVWNTTYSRCLSIRVTILELNYCCHGYRTARHESQLELTILRCRRFLF